MSEIQLVHLEEDNKNINSEILTRGFIFACTRKTEAESLKNLLFATEKIYGPIVIRIRKGDLIFLNNLDTDVLYGVFRAVSDGGFNLDPNAFGGKYPYQVKVQPVSKVLILNNAKKILDRLEIRRNKPLWGETLIRLLEAFSQQTLLFPYIQIEGDAQPINQLILSIKNSCAKLDIEEEIPIIEATTFWDFPKQSYGLTPKGNNKYAGVTPALIIFNLIWRYTNPGELVVDPMCGSGTTIDVCEAEKRRVIGYDIHPTRPDIIENDARQIPLENESVDMVFIDSPYGDNIKYNDSPANIGNISCESDEFYNELEKVMSECARILKPGKVLGWLIGDQWVRNRFTPVGFRIYERLCKYFEPMDIICVSRRGQYSHTGIWYNRARRFNFYLRGFKYLIIVRKQAGNIPSQKPRKIEWTYYQRG